MFNIFASDFAVLQLQYFTFQLEVRKINLGATHDDVYSLPPRLTLRKTTSFLVKCSSIHIYTFSFSLTCSFSLFGIKIYGIRNSTLEKENPHYFRSSAARQLPLDSSNVTTVKER